MKPPNAAWQKKDHKRILTQDFLRQARRATRERGNVHTYMTDRTRPPNDAWRKKDKLK